jgi:autotransporter-associated beta strand protein
MLRLITAVATVLLATATALPAIYTWDGQWDTNWSQKKNWNPENQGRPNSADTASLSASPGTVLIDVNSDIGSVEITGSGSWAFTGTRTLTVVGTFYYTSSGSSTFSAPLAGTMSSGLLKAGTGTLVLSSGSNTFSGTSRVTGGVLGVTADGALGGTSSGTVVSAGGSLWLGNVNYASAEALSIVGAGYNNQGALFSTGTSTWASGVALAGTSVIATSGQLTIGGVISGSGGLTKDGPGRLVLTNTNTYTGGTKIAAGTLVGGVESIRGDIVDNGTLILAVTGNVTFANVITGSGGLQKIGPGKLAITSTCTYSGTTLISDGRLQVRGALPNTSLVLSGSGRLIGDGRIGNLTIASGGVLSPGNSPGEMPTASQTWEGGGSYQWEVDMVTASGADQSSLQGLDAGFDHTTVTGTLYITATTNNKFIIDITGLAHSTHELGAVANWPTAEGRNFRWVILTASGGISGFDAGKFDLRTSNFTGYNPLSGRTFELYQQGSELVLMTVPEPTTLAVIALGGGLLLARRRFR